MRAYCSDPLLENNPHARLNQGSKSIMELSDSLIKRGQGLTTIVVAHRRVERRWEVLREPDLASGYLRSYELPQAADGSCGKRRQRREIGLHLGDRCATPTARQAPSLKFGIFLLASTIVQRLE